MNDVATKYRNNIWILIVNVKLGYLAKSLSNPSFVQLNLNNRESVNLVITCDTTNNKCKHSDYHAVVSPPVNLVISC